MRESEGDRETAVKQVKKKRKRGQIIMMCEADLILVDGHCLTCPAS